MRVKLIPEEVKKIKNALGQCWANVAHDVEAQYKNGNVPIGRSASEYGNDEIRWPDGLQHY